VPNAAKHCSVSSNEPARKEARTRHAIIDTRNLAPGANLAPFIIGLIVVGIGMTLGGVLGAYVYDIFITRFLPVAEPEVGRVPEPSGATSGET
jgi:hypothetical protein